MVVRIDPPTEQDNTMNRLLLLIAVLAFAGAMLITPRSDAAELGHACEAQRFPTIYQHMTAPVPGQSDPGVVTSWWRTKDKTVTVCREYRHGRLWLRVKWKVVTVGPWTPRFVAEPVRVSR